MDFRLNEPLHLLALFLMGLTILFIVIFPIVTFFTFDASDQLEQTGNIISQGGIFLEIFFLLFQFAIVIIALILIPIFWYMFVNNLSFKQSLKKMRLTLENIDIAFLWAVLSIIIIFGIFFIVELILIVLGFNPDELGNIQDLEGLFSPVSLFLLIAIQPVAEEIFFRGFLLEKVEVFAGKYIAIISTSILFGIAHLGYGKLYPAVFPIIIGLIFAFIVLKTKNLYASIFAHIFFNVISFGLYMFARHLV